ncbi:MAG: transporter substrate-binding domain-containing protein [Actinophytocola sp.]|nr:transporter substrate-binding domain-containing protein [Actinophytocola sp.]
MKPWALMIAVVALLASACGSPGVPQADTMTDCLVLLQQGQVEAISTDDTVLAGLAEQDPATKVVGSTFSSEPYGIGIPKDNEDMVRYVNAALEDVHDGAWQDSYDRWLEPALGPATPPTPSYQ